MCFFFKLIKVHLFVSELYIYQNVRYNNKNIVQDEVRNLFYASNINNFTKARPLLRS